MKVETETWLLKDPSVALTKAEREWFDWAVEGAREVLSDQTWLADNDDALTVEGQLLDLRYRLETQAYDMTDGAPAFGSNPGAARRVLNSLNAKLEDSGYWNKGSHQ